MKTAFIVAFFVSASALSVTAQQSPPANPDGNTPAVATPDSKNPTAPVEGANSFTEAQAKERIEEAGYMDVTGLKKDAQGIWMAAAKKDGKPVSVALDYQGNVVAK